jgi:hypothetical protein
VLNINKQLYNVKSLIPHKDLSVQFWKNENLIEIENVTTNKKTWLKLKMLQLIRVPQSNQNTSGMSK